MRVFLLLNWLPYQSWRAQFAVLFNHNQREYNLINTFLRGISVMWNAKGFTPDMNLYIHTYMCKHVYIYIYIYVYIVVIYMCECVCICIYISMYIIHICICIFIYVYIYIYAYPYIYVYLYAQWIKKKWKNKKSDQ